MCVRCVYVVYYACLSMFIACSDFVSCACVRVCEKGQHQAICLLLSAFVRFFVCSCVLAQSLPKKGRLQGHTFICIPHSFFTLVPSGFEINVNRFIFIFQYDFF